MKRVALIVGAAVLVAAFAFAGWRWWAQRGPERSLGELGRAFQRGDFNTVQLYVDFDSVVRAAMREELAQPDGAPPGEESMALVDALRPLAVASVTDKVRFLVEAHGRTMKPGAIDADVGSVWRGNSNARVEIRLVARAANGERSTRTVWLRMRRHDKMWRVVEVENFGRESDEFLGALGRAY